MFTNLFCFCYFECLCIKYCNKHLYQTNYTVIFQICFLLAAAEVVPFIPFLCDPKIPDEVVDTAEITIYNDEGLKRPVVVYLQSEQCYKVTVH